MLSQASNRALKYWLAGVYPVSAGTRGFDRCLMIC